MKSKLRAVLILVCISFLIGCQRAPDEQPIVSKKDGVLESRLFETRPQGEKTPSHIEKKDDFVSTDGSVQFHWDINQNLPTKALPALEVAARNVTSEDCERVARALLGDVDFYEREPTLDPHYSKVQYQQMLGRLAPYSNLDAMNDLVGSANAQDWLERVQNAVCVITEAMETAPEENPHVPCNWELKKERVYNNATWEIAGRPPEQDNDWLVATAEKDGMSYKYMVISRNQEDYKLNRYLIQLGAASLENSIDRKIFWSRLCRTGEPTDEQIESVKDRVAAILKDMELGDWEIVDTEIEISDEGAEDEYIIQINAVPTFQGIPALFNQDQVSKENDYTGAYSLTKARFLMSVNGDLLDMHLDSPLRVESITNENVAVLPISQLLDRAQQHLSLSDASNYGITREYLDDSILCHVTIPRVEYGLARIMIENTTEKYRYVPALMLYGDVEYRRNNSEETYYRAENRPLMCINAIDGSIIQ